MIAAQKPSHMFPITNTSLRSDCGISSFTSSKMTPTGPSAKPKPFRSVTPHPSICQSLCMTCRNVFFSGDGQGFREALAVLSPATDTWETLLYISRIESKNCGYFCGCDIDFQRGLLAVIFSRLAVVVDLKTMNILQKQPIQYGSDILWMDDDRLLLATWNGLFLMTLLRVTVESQPLRSLSLGLAFVKTIKRAMWVGVKRRLSIYSSADTEYVRRTGQ